MIRIVILSFAILVMAIAIAQSENRSVTAQTPDNKPEIREAPTATATPTLVPKREAEQEYAAGSDCASGGETGDSSVCSGAHGQPQYVPTSTPRPTATATPKPKPTATPQPRATATPKPKPTATPRSNSGGNGGSSSGTSGNSGTTKTKPPAPTGFKAVAGTKLSPTGKNTLNLSWNRRSGVDYYRTWISDDDGDSWIIKSRRIDGNAASYVDLRCGKFYRLKIAAYGDGKKYLRAFSSPIEISAKTTICPPRLVGPPNRENCPDAKRAKAGGVNDGITIVGTRDGEFHAARSAAYRSLFSVWTAFIDPPAPNLLNSIAWCAFGHVETASTDTSRTRIFGKFYHGNTTSLGAEPPSRMKTGSNGWYCGSAKVCNWGSGTEVFHSGFPNGRGYAVGTHRIASGRQTITIYTSGGFDPTHSGAPYAPAPKK